MAETKPIERIENYDLLQTDLKAYIRNEVGIDLLEHEDPNRPRFTEADLSLSPMAVMSSAFGQSLDTNILDGKVAGEYPAIVLLSFKAGQDGVQSCKAVVPGLHDNVGNPFNAPNEAERAEMISHFPTFSFNDPLAEASSPIVPGSIIMVSFDNPQNYWSSGAIEKVIRGKPKSLPEYAKNLEGVKELFDSAASWVTGALMGLVGGTPGGRPVPFPPAPKTAWEQLQTHGTAGISKAPDGICVAVAGGTFQSGQWPLFPVSGRLGQLDTAREATSIDIGCKVGTPIYAAADGVILDTNDHSDLCGGTVLVKYTNPNKKQTYCHCSEIPDVPKNHPIKRGDVIGLTGGQPGSPGAGNTTAPHLHISTGMKSVDFAKAFGWDFSSKNAGKTIVGKSSCEGK